MGFTAIYFVVSTVFVLHFDDLTYDVAVSSLPYVLFYRLVLVFL